MLVTNGGKHAVYNCFEALLNPGEEVLLPTPYWTTYPEPIALAGGVTVPLITTAEPAGSGSPIDQLEAARTPNTKASCSCRRRTRPARSTRRHEIEAIGRWAAEHGIWVITDEIYEHLVYGDNEHPLDRHARARTRRQGRRAQRRGQDLRDDRLAGRLDDRSRPT